MKILVVFGTRPEAIKLAPIIKCFSRSKIIEFKVCVTGQHREMLDQVLKLFDIKPDYDLNIMKKKQSLSDVTINILKGIQPVLESFRPDLVMVHGDTATTFAASLASFYYKIDIAHVEAGLRTNDLYSPWPEEANRKLTSVLAKFNFCPTEEASVNLLREGVDKKNIYITGNTVIDSLLNVCEIVKGRKESEVIAALSLESYERIILVTGHRRENFGRGFEKICNAILNLAKRYENACFVYPVHLNECVREPVQRILGGMDNVKLIEPLDYEPFVELMNKSYLILTDSGGIQEEAPSLGKPVLVMRDTTERPEGIKAGAIKLVGTDENSIVEQVQLLMDFPDIYQKMALARNPYGDGTAAKKICSILEHKSLVHN